MGAQGKVTGLSGGSSRLGHEQPSEAEIGTPELEHAGGFDDIRGVIEAIGSSESHEPIDGNDLGTNPRSMHADSDRNVVET